MKLQTKLLLIMAPAFLVAFVIQGLANYRAAHQEVLVELRREARNIRDVLMATRRVYHHQFLDSGIPLNSKTVGFLPAHALSRISQDFKTWSEGGLAFNNVSDRPRNPDNAADALEMEAIAFYRDNKDIQERFVAFESDEGKPFYHYSRPIWIESYCLKCHGKREDAPATIQASYDSAFDYQEGELRGIMSIRLPAGAAEARAATAAWRHFLIDAVIYACVFVLAYRLLVHYVARRLKDLEECCGRLAGGDYGFRSGITGDDEIGHVAAVFDGMAERIEDRDAALHASEERSRKIVDTAHDAFVAVGSDGAITAWNQQAEHTFGWSRDEILGQEAATTIIPPQYRDTHLRAIKDLRETGTVEGMNRRFEVTALHRDGHEFPVELAVADTHVGQNLSIGAFVRDITERKRAEEEVHKLSVAVEQSPATVVITDLVGTITYVNRRFTETTGYTREEALGQNPRILKSGNMPRRVYEKLWKMLCAGETWRGEFQNRKKNGELYWESASISPVRTGQGEVTHYVAVKEEITERKRREEELKRAMAAATAADLAKSEFLANMSHEIRTPMTAILGFADNIAENVTKAGNVDSIAIIRKNGESLLGIINDILDLSKIEAGRMEAKRVICEPCSLVAEVSSLVRGQVDAKGLQFHIEYDGAVPETIHTDAARLRQILINLVGNAIKFTETGAVRLVTRFLNDSDGPCLQFDVIDTGIGIPEEEKEKLFQPFMQLDNSATRRFGGTGLGLTISKRFAELLGGDIVVAATEVGVGTTFRATVATGPLDGVSMLDDPIGATVVADSGTAVPQVSPIGLHGRRILLAEDNAANQVLVVGILKKAGGETTLVKDGKAALDVALAARDAGNPFDVILMDIQMPIMDGCEATAQLRKAGYAGVIIALTAHAMDGDDEKCFKAGCDDYVTKPINRGKLIETIQQRLARDGVESSAAT